MPKEDIGLKFKVGGVVHAEETIAKYRHIAGEWLQVGRIHTPGERASVIDELLFSMYYHPQKPLFIHLPSLTPEDIAKVAEEFEKYSRRTGTLVMWSTERPSIIEYTSVYPR